MMKAIATLNYFVMLAIASSFLSLLATLHPSALALVQSLYLLALVLWILGWILDDALIAKFSVGTNDYRAIMLIVGVAIIFGLGVTLCRS